MKFEVKLMHQSTIFDINHVDDNLANIDTYKYRCCFLYLLWSMQKKLRMMMFLKSQKKILNWHFKNFYVDKNKYSSGLNSPILNWSLINNSYFLRVIFSRIHFFTCVIILTNTSGNIFISSDSPLFLETCMSNTIFSIIVQYF